MAALPARHRHILAEPLTLVFENVMPCQLEGRRFVGIGTGEAA